MSVTESFFADSRSSRMSTVPDVAAPPAAATSRRKKEKLLNPQQKVDQFWTKFTTKAPGKATTVIPQNQYAEKAARREAARVVGGGQTTQASYEEAAALCRAKVTKIVAECRRVNQKYRDPHFDLEFDLKLARRDCLDSLDNIREQKRRGRRGEDDDEVWRPQKDRAGGDTGPASGGVLGLIRDVDKENERWPGAGDLEIAFRPQAVKRVVDIFDKPQFYIDGPTANDVRQGRDGDCWLLAALCTLSNKSGLIERVCVAHDQDVGVYGFVFHRDGEWFSEIIDDKLYLNKPDYDESFLERILWEDRDRVNSEEAYRKIYQSNSGALYFAQCENPNETWLPLLEKAYAKAHGDYTAIEGGFTGEGIEDLTGGVTSEIYTTDILDKEHFWKDELLKVNKEFLFGCSTGVWGRGWGERKGIVELHAYSVMRAVEVDGLRLVLLKNPWGKHEWKGPWSDGSKEWTAEWLKKLDHKFGDDGSFWISYDDLLRKYQAFDRTRLFGADWKVASIWTTLNIPWTLEYHDTKFAFSLARSGPVVIVLSQLDERYFRGLEGQYRFELSFRIHRAGDDDYVVRSQTYYRMNRSVNIELDPLEAGEYNVVVRIDAQRNDRLMPVEEVVRANAKTRREKLIRIGLAYDLAHGKGKIIETAEEKVAREAYEKRKKEKARAECRRKMEEEKEEDHYLRQKSLRKMRKRTEEKRARKKAREERKKAEREKKVEELRKKRREEEDKKGDESGSEGKKSDEESKTDDSASEGKDEEKPKSDETKDGKPKASDTKGDDAKVIKTDDGLAEEKSAEEKSSTSSDDKKEDDLSKESKKQSLDNKSNEVETETVDQGHVSKEDASKDVDSSTEQGDNTPSSSVLEKSSDDIRSQLHTGDAGNLVDQTESVNPNEKDPGHEASAEPTPEEEARQVSTPKPPAAQETSDQPESAKEESKEKSKLKTVAESEDTDSKTPEADSSNDKEPPPKTKEVVTPSPPDQKEHRHAGRRHQGVQTSPPRMAPPPFPMGFRPPPPGSGIPPHMRRLVPRPYSSDGSDSSDDDDLHTLSDVSEISDREVDIRMADYKRAAAQQQPQAVQPPTSHPPRYEEEDEFEKDPWNAVGVFGLRVYYKTDDGDGDKEVVKLWVQRPDPYADEEEEEGEKGKGSAHPEEEKNEAKVLDVDDSAKDATLGVEEAEKKAGILPEKEAEKIDGREPEKQTEGTTDKKSEEEVVKEVEAVKKEEENVDKGEAPKEQPDQEKTSHDEAVME